VTRDKSSEWGRGPSFFVGAAVHMDAMKPEKAFTNLVQTRPGAHSVPAK